MGVGQEDTRKGALPSFLAHRGGRRQSDGRGQVAEAPSPAQELGLHPGPVGHRGGGGDRLGSAEQAHNRLPLTACMVTEASFLLLFFN